MNGWRRLWVLVGILWIVPVVIIVGSLWPAWPEPPVRSASERTHVVLSDGDTVYDIPALGRVQFPRTMSNAEVETAISNLLTARHVANEQRIARDRRLLIGIGCALWLVPLVALYALGSGLAWVRRGFRARIV